MAKEKDPAFLFYSKDWLEGTNEFSPEEKGVMIDLMANQHQKKSLPTDTTRLARMVSLGHDDFLRIWVNIKHKFVEIDTTDGVKLINEKLNNLMIIRSEKGHRNTIIGIFASLLRTRDLNKKQYSELKKQFNANNFTQIETERLTERITEWFELCLKSIENGNENEDIDNKGGVGEKEDDNITDKAKFEIFIKMFNDLTGKKCRGNRKIEASFNARIKEGYTGKDFVKAIRNILSDPFHKESGFKYLTPEFITRADKLDRYINFEHPDTAKQPKLQGTL